MNEPQLILNYWAILVAVLAAWFLGSLWYGPIFGKAWMKEMNLPEDFKPEKKDMYKSMGIMFLGALLTSYVMAHSSQIWRPSVWGLTGDQPAYIYGFFGGFFSWLGFNIPIFLNDVAFENKSWKLFWINAGYQFFSLQAMGMILAYWR